ncbi:hypothetical protein VNO77_24281 [Canavalia gladiata]|uniref:Uncharacterized protein n=1 Tax=Canavalia gladiata TaxID=3824 RepID=A0AAN9Q9R7_CANGL
MTLNDSTPCCNQLSETILHVLRDCDMVADLWTIFLKPAYWSSLTWMDPLDVKRGDCSWRLDPGQLWCNECFQSLATGFCSLLSDTSKSQFWQF